jgi:hypothetical protein
MPGGGGASREGWHGIPDKHLVHEDTACPPVDGLAVPAQTKFGTGERVGTNTRSENEGEGERRTTAEAGAADGKTGPFGREHSREVGVGQYPLLRMISGARYSGVPQSVHVLTVGSMRLAKPKSVTCQRRVCVASCAAYSH